MKFKRIAAMLLAGIIMTSSVSACSINKNATVATMGQEEISLGLVNFFCRYQQASMDDLYKQYMGEGVWNTSYSGDGTTMQDEVKNTTMETIHEMYSLKAHMKEYHVELSDEEKNTIATTAKDFIAANSKEALDEMGADQELVEELLTLYTIKQKMYDAIACEVDTNVSDEEANMRAYSYVQIDYNQYYDQATYSYVPYSEEEKAGFEQKAKDIEAALSQEQTLEDAVKAQGLEVMTGTYDSSNDTLEEEFKKALDELTEGQTSALITTENSYYFARIDAQTDAEATETNRENIIKERKDTHYNEVLQKWQENDGWKVDKKKLAKIKFDDYFTQIKESSETTETTEAPETTETPETTEAPETTEETETTEELENDDSTEADENLETGDSDADE